MGGSVLYAGSGSDGMETVSALTEKSDNRGVGG